jgi:non-heme chloroperoxidase
MNGSTIRALSATLLLLLCGTAFSFRTLAVSINESYATTTDGIRIHYLESGNITSSRVLVLIPGWRLPAYLWNEQLQKFSQGMRVIAIDPRSQGESTKTPEGDTPEFRARDLHDVLADLKVSRCVLVGWSQGVQDVAAYVQQFGTHSLAGIVLVDSPVSAGPAQIEINPQFSEGVLSRLNGYVTEPREYCEGMVRSIFVQPHPDLDIQKIVNFTLQTPTAIAISMLVSDTFGVDRRPALAKIDKPALFIASGVSPQLAAEREAAASIRGAQFVSIEGAGHAVFVDQPEKFDDALQGFIQNKAQW